MDLKKKITWLQKMDYHNLDSKNYTGDIVRIETELCDFVVTVKEKYGFVLVAYNKKGDKIGEYKSITISPYDSFEWIDAVVMDLKDGRKI